jgi:5'-3' exonuclease
MQAPDGTPTNAAYGFASALIRYLAERRPSHLACCFDFAMTSFRNERFPGYKVSRGETPPPDLEPQFELCREASVALGVPAFEAEGYEADDVIATLTAQLSRRAEQVVVVTTDKDLAQLVTEDGRVVLHDFARDVTLDTGAVRARFGVPPALVPDWLALVGDAADDLPGVPGFGPKSAAAALGTFGGLERFPADSEAWKALPARGAARLAERFSAHREQALAVRELATVVRRVPGVRARLGELAWRGPDRERWQALCRRLGWGRIATRVPHPPARGASGRR